MNTSAYLWIVNVLWILCKIMEEVFQGLNGVKVFLHNIGIFNKTWEDTLLLYDKMLSQLEANCFTVSPLKCEWAIKETDWLGYW